jgi:steroid delta-isomerase-like uncharacterized protein
VLNINGVPVRGAYLELERPRRLLISWGHAGSERLPPGASRVEIRFTPQAGGTLVEVVHSGLPEADAAQHALGWDHFLARLAVLAPGGNPGPDPWAELADESPSYSAASMPPSRHRLETQVQRFYDELWNQWRFELADELLAPDLSFRGSLGAEVRGPQGFLDYARMVRAAFPDFHNEIQDLIIDEGKGSAAAQLTYSGTHRGAIFGSAPTGRRVTYAGATFFRFDGKARIASAWVLGDLITLLTQLGLKDMSRIAGD